MNQVTILGSGTSTGVPLLGCSCPVCLSTDPKDKRLRTSVFIETSQGKKILVDTTPDLRAQFLEHNITDLDFALITHDHADHIHGIDDLRPLCFKDGGKTIPILTDESHLKSITGRFPYIFQSDKIFSKDKPVLGGGIPNLTLHEVALGKPFNAEEEIFTFFLLPHGYTKTLGFVHEKMAYLVDCASVAEDIIVDLMKRNLDLVIIDSVRVKPHKTHLNFDQAIEVIKKINPKKGLLIHMSHDLSHMQIIEKCQGLTHPDISPAYDGQKLSYGDA